MQSLRPINFSTFLDCGHEVTVLFQINFKNCEPHGIGGTLLLGWSSSIAFKKSPGRVQDLRYRINLVVGGGSGALESHSFIKKDTSITLNFPKSVWVMCHPWSTQLEKPVMSESRRGKKKVEKQNYISKNDMGTSQRWNSKCGNYLLVWLLAHVISGSAMCG